MLAASLVNFGLTYCRAYAIYFLRIDCGMIFVFSAIGTFSLSLKNFFIKNKYMFIYAEQLLCLICFNYLNESLVVCGIFIC